jgi:lipopolysaccharide/colanic/teichoic acid biosynthesis glycosyltransferase
MKNEIKAMINTTAAKRKRDAFRHSNSEEYKFGEIRTVSPASYFKSKAWFDFVIAIILLLPCFVMSLILAFFVKLSSRGPAIYTQCRLGKNGRKFKIYKLRTMVHNAECKTGPVWTQSNDDRITMLGRFMRKFHLDELPQIINVLKGDMSMVGPRPERPEFVEVLSRQIPEYSDRMVIRPGITGLAQLNLPPDSDIHSVRAKLKLDLEYVENGGFWLDIRIILCTFLRIFKLPVIGPLGLHRNIVLDDDLVLENNKIVTHKKIHFDVSPVSYAHLKHHEMGDDLDAAMPVSGDFAPPLKPK